MRFSFIYSSQYNRNMSQRSKRASEEREEEGLSMEDLEQSQLSTAANNEEIASDGAIQIVWAW